MPADLGGGMWGCRGTVAAPRRHGVPRCGTAAAPPPHYWHPPRGEANGSAADRVEQRATSAAGDRGPDTRYCHVLHAVRHQKKRSILSLAPSPLRSFAVALSVVARMFGHRCRPATSDNAPGTSSGCLNNGGRAEEARCSHERAFRDWAGH